MMTKAMGWVLAAALAAVMPAATARGEDFGTTQIYEEDGSDADTHTLNADGTEITVSGGKTYTLGGTIGGTGNLIKIGDGTLVLANGVNTYTGGTIVKQGILRIGHWDAINADSLHYAVSGSGAKLLSTTSLLIGFGGTGVLGINNGGEAAAADTISMGYTSGGVGIATVRGAGSMMETPNLTVGYEGTGILNVTDGGKAESAGDAIVGSVAGGSGTVTVSGSGSELDVGRSLVVGNSGDGILHIMDQGKVTVDLQVLIGDQSSSSGVVTVGANSALESGGIIYVGGGGTGRGLLAGTGTVTADDGVRVTQYGVLSAGDATGEIGTLTIVRGGGTGAALNLSNNATLRVDSDGSGSNTDCINVIGNASNGGGALINIDLGNLNDIAGETIISVSGGTMGIVPFLGTATLNGVGIGLLADRVTSSSVTFGTTATELTLTTAFTAQSQISGWNGGTSGVWDMTTGGNWFGNHASEKFLAGDVARFFSSGMMDITVAEGGATASGMWVSGGGEWSFTGDISVAGYTWVGTGPVPSVVDGKLRIDNATRVTLNGNNYFQNGIEIAVNSSLTLKSQTSGGSAQITNNGDLILDFSGVFANDVVATNYGSGRLFKTGAGETLLSGNHDLGGLVSVEAGTLTITGTLNSTNHGGGANDHTGGFEIAADAAMVLNQTFDQTLGNTLTGAGTLIKEGANTFTLVGSGTGFTGDVIVSEGTMKIGNNGYIGRSRTVVEAAGTLDITDFAGGSYIYAVYNNFEAANGATLITGTNTLALDGGSLVFDLNGVAANAATPVLTVTGGGIVLADGDNVSLKNASLSLQGGDEIILADTASGSISGESRKSGRMRYTLKLDSGALIARIGFASFVEATNDYLQGLAPGNVNIRNGGTYLDELLTTPFGGTPGMQALDDYFTEIVDTLPVRQGWAELQRMYGAYSAYANQALLDDANRFRRVWGKRSRSFLDDLFVDVSLASEGGWASPVHGARECVPAGSSRFWASGFGSWADQDGRSGLAGYKYDSRGLAVGFDHTRDRVRFGVAAAYSRGDLKVDGLGYRNRPDAANFAVYGAYGHESGLYVEGGLGYGHAWNEYRVDMTLGGKKTGKYGSDVFSADVEIGYAARFGNGATVTPTVGVEYDYVRNGSWSERLRGTAVPANRFDDGGDHSVNVPVGVGVGKVFAFGCEGGFVRPEARVSYVYNANRARASVRSSFGGAPGWMTMRGVDPGRGHWRFGAGLSGRVNSRVDYRVDYEFEARSGFRGHNVNAGVGVSF